MEPPKDDLQKLLSPLQAADPSEFLNGRDPSWPSLDETLQWEADGTPSWWPKEPRYVNTPWNRDLPWKSGGERRQVLLRRLRENLPTSLTTPETSAERQQVVDSLRRIYAGLLSGASGILSS